MSNQLHRHGAWECRAFKIANDRPTKIVKDPIRKARLDTCASPRASKAFLWPFIRSEDGLTNRVVKDEANDSTTRPLQRLGNRVTPHEHCPKFRQFSEWKSSAVPVFASRMRKPNEATRIIHFGPTQPEDFHRAPACQICKISDILKIRASRSRLSDPDLVARLAVRVSQFLETSNRQLDRLLEAIHDAAERSALLARRGRAGGLARAGTAWRYADGTFMAESQKLEIYREEYERYASDGRARAKAAKRAVDGTFLPR